MLLGVPDELITRDEQYMAAALDEMRQRYWTIEGYFDEGLGLDADVQSAIRIAFLERDSEAAVRRRSPSRP
jgi:hypothetical protein